MSRHALRRLSPVDLVAAVVARVSGGTGVRCVLDPGDERSPLYSVSLTGMRPERSKSLRIDVYELQVHAISAPSRTSEAALSMVWALQEAMEADVELPRPFCLVRQDDMGLQSVKRDPTGEWHAVVAYEVTVSYGLMVK